MLLLLAVVFLIGLSLASQTAFFNSDAVIALRGFSAIEFVVANQNPSGFERDFPGGSRVTTSTSPLTWVHLFASNIGLDSLFVYYVMVTLEIATLLAGLYVFWRSLFSVITWAKSANPSVKNWSFVTLAALVLLSNGQRMNLANFGFPFFHGQFYGFADGLRLAAIGLALQKRWWASAVFLSAAFVIHPIKGLFGAVVVLVIFCFSVTSRTALAGLGKLAFFPLVGAVWTLITLTRPLMRIEVSEFVAWTQIFQGHWYPLNIGIFTTRQFEYFVPFATVVVLTLVGVVMVVNRRRIRLALASSIGVLTILTFIGVAISVWLPSEFLIKLSLIRASELVVLLAIPTLLFFAIYFFTRNRFVWSSIYTVPLLIFFLPTGGFHFLSLLAVAVPVALMLRESRSYLAWATAGVWGMLVVVHLGLMLLSGGFLKAGQGLFGAVFVSALLAGFFTILGRKNKTAVATVMLLTMVGGATYWAVLKVERDFPIVDVGREYLDVQIWANENSDPTALFMVDPCINYGWRDFSARASLGTPREWFMTGWLYTGDGGVLEWGKEISRTLGLDPDPELLGPLSAGEICERAREAFYSPGLKNLFRISDDFGVNYFILYRNEFETRTGVLPETWEITFGNDTFIVIEPRVAQ